MGFCVVFIPVLIVIALFVWFLSNGLDHERIREYIESRGGKVMESAKKPLGNTWWEQFKERLYEVHYADADGHEHISRVRTGLLTGMTWTEDSVVRFADQIKKEQSLEKDKQKLIEENQYLREELDRLKNQPKEKTDDEERRFFEE